MLFQRGKHSRDQSGPLSDLSGKQVAVKMFSVCRNVVTDSN